MVFLSRQLLYFVYVNFMPQCTKFLLAAMVCGDVGTGSVSLDIYYYMS